MSERVLALRSVSVTRGDTLAVDGVTIDLRRGELLALVGPSGCGKTSLLRAVAGFEPLTAGSIEIDGEVVAGPGRWVAPERRHVGMVFQQGALFPHLSVLKNVEYGVREKDESPAVALAALKRVGLSHLGERYPDELSGGQQQRVALARALAPGPRLILLDEPFASLDADLRGRLRREVREVLKEIGTSAVLVTHDQEEAFSIADRVAVMLAGRVLQVDEPERVYRRPATAAVADFLGGGLFFTGTVRGGVLSTALGEVPCSEPEGRAILFVRPEDLSVDVAGAESPSGPSVEGTLVHREFFGHDVLDRVELAGGGRIDIRGLSSRLVPVGSRVRIGFRSRELIVFADSGDRASHIAIS